MESLLCDEVWLMSPNNALDNNVQENDECINAEGHVLSTKEDCEEVLRIFLGKEATHMPERGYLKLVKTNDIIHDARFKGVHWLIKSQGRMNLSPGTVFLAVNYMDRFISLTDQCQDWKYWMFELLSVACLSIASKFNEKTTHLLHEFQVECVGNCFAPTLIQRMELTVLKTLGWKMDSTTTFSYVHILTQSIDALNKTIVEDLTKHVTELLLCALLDPEFLEFQQCVVAMSAVRRVFGDLFPSKNYAALAQLDSVIPQDQKDDLITCRRIMEKLWVQDHKMLACGNSWQGPSSPVTVLKVAWFNFYNCPVDETNINLRQDRKRKREELN